MTHPTHLPREQRASTADRDRARRQRLEQRRHLDRRVQHVTAWLRSLGPRRTGLS